MRLSPAGVILTGLALTCLCSVTFAHQNDVGFDGFYVGASVGGTTTSVSQDKIVQNEFISAAIPITLLTHEAGPNELKTNNSFKGALYAGYGQCWDVWYLGGEIFADYAKYKNLSAVEVDSFITPNLTPGVTEFQADTHTKLSNFQFGIDLRPGILLTPNSMLYGRIGLAFSDLDLDTNAIYANNSPGVPESWTLLLPLSTEKDVAALRLGGGLEQHICPRLNVRLDYIFTYYGRASVAGFVDQTLPAQNDVVLLGSDTTVKVYNNTMMLGLTYLIK